MEIGSLWNALVWPVLVVAVLYIFMRFMSKNIAGQSAYARRRGCGACAGGGCGANADQTEAPKQGGCAGGACKN